MTDQDPVVNDDNLPSPEAGAEVKSTEPEAPPPDDPKADDPTRYTKAINRKHFEMEEQKRRGDDLQQQVDALKKQLPDVQVPVVPDMPEQYDEHFDRKVQERDVEVQKLADYNAQQKQNQQDQQRQILEHQQKQEQELLSRADTYTKRGEKLGLSLQEQQIAGRTVQTFGIGDELAGFLLDDEQGPLLTSYLAKNPEEITTLREMSTLQAVAHIATEIRPKVKAATGIPGAPDPVDGLSGGGAPPSKRGPPNATYT